MCSSTKLVYFLIVVCNFFQQSTPATPLSPPKPLRTANSTVISDLFDFEDINSKKTKSEIFDSLFEGAGYDTKLRPPGINGSGPTEIHISLLIRSIENIDDVQMQYSVQLTFRQEWVDPRLKYFHVHHKIKYLQLVLPERIWNPDIFFSNEKEGKLHELMIPNLFTRVYPDGKILQSYRITLLLSCPMDLRAYPLDVQRCPIEMASYGWTTQDIIIKWRKEDAVVMAKSFTMPSFKTKNHSMSDCTRSTITGAYSCIKLQIEFAREFGFYLIQIYIPCSMLSLVSWVTFWLEPSAVEARVSLGVTSILAIVTQIYGINQSAPPASYLKAMDVWTAFCQVTVFGSLLEFAVVIYITTFRIKAKKKQQKKSDVNIEEEDEEFKELVEQAYQKATTIDKTSRILFPLIFVLFNIIYWSYYLDLI